MRITDLSVVSPGELAALFNAVYADYFWTVSHTEESMAETLIYMKMDPQLSAVLWVDGRPCGFALIAALDQECWLYSLGVLPALRGRGYGRMMMETVLAGAREAGMTRMGLEVLLQNTVPRRMYRKYGFRRLCLLDSYEFEGRLNRPAGGDFRSLDSAEARAVWQRLEGGRRTEAVWSLRPETLLRRKISWLALYEEGDPIGLLAYDRDDMTIYYRLFAERECNHQAVAAALLGEACAGGFLRQYMVNIMETDRQLQRTLLNLGFSRFMQQEYLVCQLNPVYGADSHGTID